MTDARSLTHGGSLTFHETYILVITILMCNLCILGRASISIMCHTAFDVDVVY